MYNYKINALGIILVHLLFGLILSSCIRSNNVVNNSIIQKRKYQKGFYIHIPGKSKKNNLVNPTTAAAYTIINTPIKDSITPIIPKNIIVYDTLPIIKKVEISTQITVDSTIVIIDPIIEDIPQESKIVKLNTAIKSEPILDDYYYDYESRSNESKSNKTNLLTYTHITANAGLSWNIVQNKNVHITADYGFGVLYTFNTVGFYIGAEIATISLSSNYKFTYHHFKFPIRMHYITKNKPINFYFDAGISFIESIGKVKMPATVKLNDLPLASHGYTDLTASAGVLMGDLKNITTLIGLRINYNRQEYNLLTITLYAQILLNMK